MWRDVRGLPLHGLDHLRVGVADELAAQPGGEVEQRVAVDVGERGAVALGRSRPGDVDVERVGGRPRLALEDAAERGPGSSVTRSMALPIRTSVGAAARLRHGRGFFAERPAASVHDGPRARHRPEACPALDRARCPRETPPPVDVDDEKPPARCARNCGGAYMAWARAAGRPTRADEDLLLADLGLPVALPANSATLVRPLRPDGVAALLERLGALLSRAPAAVTNGWQALADAGSVSSGVRPHHGPGDGSRRRRRAAAAPAGAPRRAGDLGRRLRRCREDCGRGLRRWRRRFGDHAGEHGRRRFARGVGPVDGEPVTTATAYTSDGFVGVCAVAISAAARDRGFGEAVSWEAVRWRPDLTATLQASPMGGPSTSAWDSGPSPTARSGAADALDERGGSQGTESRPVRGSSPRIDAHSSSIG